MMSKMWGKGWGRRIFIFRNNKTGGSPLPPTNHFLWDKIIFQVQNSLKTGEPPFGTDFVETYKEPSAHSVIYQLISIKQNNKTEAVWTK